MKLPRDLSREEVVRLLSRHHGYELRRRRGSHMTVTLVRRTRANSVTVPRHRDSRIGTLGRIVSDVAAFFGSPKQDVRQDLLGR